MRHRRPNNGDVVRALRELALFLQMDEVPFKPQAYEKAAHAIAALDRPLSQLYAEGGKQALDSLPAIGKGIAERIAQMLETGTMADLDEFRAKTPIDVLALTAIEGIGPKKARALWEALQVRSVGDLERAAKTGRIQALPHFGERSQQHILEAIAFHKELAGRRPLGDVLGLARSIEVLLATVRGVARVVVAGSIRRHRDTIGDVDVLAAAESPAEASAAFEAMPEVQKVLARGPTKTLVRLSNGINADLRVIPPGSFGAALMYFTGSKAHNVALRKIAQKQGLKLNEYGLFRGDQSIASHTEEQVYEALGLAWVPPEMREDTGEVELARRSELPRLVAAEDIRGDLQVHTNWTDGSASVEAMARAARELGREYLVITDHTRDLPMTGGLDEKRLRAQIAEVRRVDRELGGIRVLAGAELNIRADGTLDLDGPVLAELDLVGAAIHSHFDQPRDEMTRRLLRAVQDPRVDVLFHPVCRALGRRRAIDFDFDAVLQECVQHGTILEIDAQPARLDLPDALVRTAVRSGARIAIDSDAHTVDELRFIETFGLGVARRGWVERAHVVNTLHLAELRALVHGRPAYHGTGRLRTPATHGEGSARVASHGSVHLEVERP